MSIVKKLVEFGVIEEFNDWARHFLAGSKGQIKTDPEVIEFVQNLLSQEFPNDQSKVNNLKLAPWIVDTVRTLGLNQVGDVEINKLKVIIDWFKTSNTETPIKNKDLEAAYQYVLSKRPPEQKNKEEQEPSTEQQDEEAPHLEAERSGRIKRVGSVNDGSKRIWVEVVDLKWMKESSELNRHRTWGVKCQAYHDTFQSPSILNIQLIGPPNGNPNGPWSTQLAIGSLRRKKSIKEVKQEDNQMPGTQKTSNGYSDGAEVVVDFLCYNSFAKENLKVFTDYTDNVPGNDRSHSEYGGDKFLIYLMQNKTALFNKLIDCREDIFENNRALIISVMGQDWFDERELDLETLIERSPISYLEKFDKLYKRFGDEATNLLVNRINLLEINRTNPEIIMNSLSSLIGRIPSDLFIKLFKDVDLKEYILNYNNDFKELVRFSSELKEYKNLFDYLVTENPQIIMQAFGKNLTGVLKFMNYVTSPHKREHQDAKYDPKKEQYFRYKDEPYRNPDGSLVLNPDGTRKTFKKLVWIPDDLSIMKLSERRKFLEKNKELIKTWIKGNDFEKNMHFIRMLVREMSEQEAKKVIESNGLKEKIIEYYNEKYKEYLNDTKKGDDFLRKKYGTNIKDIDGQIIYKKMKPGILEFYQSFKLGKQADRKIPLSELRSNLDIIKNYFATQSKYADLTNKKIDGFTEFLNIYKENGAPDEELMKLINLVNKSNLQTSGISKIFYSKALDLLNPKLKAKIFMSLKPHFEKFGYQGKLDYDDVLKTLSTPRYNVNPGDLVVFLGNRSPKEKRYNLSDRKHLVIDVRNVYRDGSSDDSDKSQDDILEYNGEVLVAEDENLGIYGGENVWVPSSRFRINKTYILDGQQVNINESFNRIENQYEKLKKIINESETPSKPKYSAIVLDTNSKQILLSIISTLKKSGEIGENWKISADHVTINMGSIYDKSLLGKEIAIKVDSIGINDMVAALKVTVNEELNFSGRTPHITLAFNKEGGAKPVMSNKINEWNPFKNIVLKGTIIEVF